MRTCYWRAVELKFGRSGFLDLMNSWRFAHTHISIHKILNFRSFISSNLVRSWIRAHNSTVSMFYSFSVRDCREVGRLYSVSGTWFTAVSPWFQAPNMLHKPVFFDYCPRQRGTSNVGSDGVLASPLEAGPARVQLTMQFFSSIICGVPPKRKQTKLRNKIAIHIGPVK